MATSTFVKRIEKALEELVTLNIVTVIGTAKIDAALTEAGWDRSKITLAADSKVIWTSIDLVQGDVTTVIHPELQGDAGRELRAFHHDRETQGLAIIHQNVAALQGLVKLLDEAYRSREGRPKDLDDGGKAGP
jgi:hypothetical protein